MMDGLFQQSQGALENPFPDLPLLKRGDYKYVYDFGENLLLVSNDVISSYGVQGSRIVHGTGRVTNQLSKYWFQVLGRQFPNHFISTDIENFPTACQNYFEQLDGRAMLVRKTRPLPVSCVVRGYLCNEGWHEYRRVGSISDLRLPSGMLENQKLSRPIFTPILQDKSPENSLQTMRNWFGKELSEDLHKVSIELYLNAWKLAWDRGVLLVETCFKFGFKDSTLHLIDECITPHTSQLWGKYSRHTNSAPLFLKKNTLHRDENTSLRTASEESILENYQYLYFCLTGKSVY